MRRAGIGLLSLVVMGPAAVAVDVEALLVDGRTLRGQVVAVAPELTLAAAEGQTHKVDWSSLLELSTVGSDRGAAAAGPAPEGAIQFTLADGSRFAGTIGESSGRAFGVLLAGLGEGRLSLDMIATVQRTGLAPAAQSRVDAMFAEPADEDDRCLVLRGDEGQVLRGRLAAIDAQHVGFEWSGRQVSASWARVAALRMARPAPRQASCRVVLSDGSVVAGLVAGGDADAIELRSSAFEGLAIPWARIERIECSSDRIAWLSNLEPVRYEFEPWFRKTWEYRLNEDFDGRRIRVAGREYAHGICMHSQSSLAFVIGGRFRQFACRVGLLERMGTRGDVNVRVLGDGRPLWEHVGLRGGNGPEDLLVDVTGVHELLLIVEFGRDLDLSDEVGWVQPRLIR